MKIGQKVVCVNDKFTADILMLYKQLPKKDEVYTVRECSLGREQLLKLKDGKPVMNGCSDDSLTVRILLKELVNDTDRFHHGGKELGFNAERFRELEEECDELSHSETNELVAV